MKKSSTLLIGFQILISASTFAKDLSWTDRELAPLYRSCKMGIHAHDQIFKLYESKARLQITQKGTQELRKHFDKQDGFYEFLALHTPYLIPEGVTFSGFFETCWSYWETAKEKLRAHDPVSATAELRKWKACQSDGFRQTPPKSYQKVERCYQELIDFKK